MLSIKRVLIVLGAVAAALAPTRASAQRSGVEVWAQTCGNCHVAQPAGRYSAENWQRLLVHMMITARMTDDDAAAVRQFLMGSARQVMASQVGSDPSEKVATVPSRSGKAEPTQTDVTVIREAFPPDLTSEEVATLLAYFRTIIAR